MSRRILIIVFSLVIAALVVVLVSGIAWNRGGVWMADGRREADSVVASYEFDAAEVSRLELKLSLDDIELVPGSAGSIRLEQWTDGGLPEQRKLQCGLQDHVLSAETGKTAWSGWFVFGPPPLSRIRIELPQDLILPVRASLDAGDADIRELRLGDLELDAEMGNISIARVSGAGARIRSSAGDIDVLNSSFAMLDCATQMGNITAAEAKVDAEVKLNCSSGDQQFQGSCSSYDGSASAGNVAAEVSGAVSVAGSSSAGNVKLICPEAGSLESVNASTALGDVTVGLPYGSRISLGYNHGLGDLELDSGAGLEIGPDGIRVNIQTSAGDSLLCAA